MTKTCRGCGREFSGSETYCPDDGLRLPATDSGEAAAGSGGDPLVGVTLDGRYRILRVIGEGGMGVVYEALHVVIEKSVAVKVLRHTFTSRPDVVERFRQEAKSASRIGHPNIIDVSDFGETPSGASYIVMEMLTGEDLADILARERVLSPARAVRIVYQVARALDATHRKNIVHRDLKPENIYLISVDGISDVVKVVDFGVAKMSDVENTSGRRLTRTGMLFGTPEYMSPEQAAGKPFDHRVDVYALGAIFFELLTGRVPFEGGNFMEVLAKHGQDRVPALNEVNPGTRVSRDVERIIARALAKDPAERYATMADLANELRLVPEMAAMNNGEVAALPEWALLTPAPPPPDVSPSTAPVETQPELEILPPDRRMVLWSASAAAVAVVLLGLGVVALRSSRAEVATQTPSERPLATGARETSHSTTPISSAIPPPMPALAPPLENSGTVATAVAPAAGPESLRDEARDETYATTAPSPDPSRVELLVRTSPAGARVKVIGKDTRELCRQTPCSVSIPRGQSVRLRATFRGTTIKRQVSYAEDAELELRFAAASPPRKPEEAEIRSKPSATATAATSDLKVPELFR